MYGKCDVKMTGFLIICVMSLTAILMTMLSGTSGKNFRVKKNGTVNDALFLLADNLPPFHNILLCQKQAG